jgi:hypothetical protein
LIPVENVYPTTSSGGNETRPVNVYFNKMMAYV